MADALVSSFDRLKNELQKNNAEQRVTMAKQLENDREQLAKLEESIKAQGLETKDSQSYRDAELQLKKQELALRKQGATSRAAREEIAKEEAALQNDRFSKFFGENSFVGKALGGLGDKLSGLAGSAKGVLSTLALAAALGALSQFLQSDTWKRLKDKIIPMIASGLETFFNGMKEFAADFTAFWENPSWTNLKEIFTGDSSKFLLALAGITALLNPLKSLKLLRLGVMGLIGGVGAFSRGLNRVSSKIGGGTIDKQGRRLIKNKAGRMVVAPGQKGAGKFAKAIPKTAFLKGLGKGILAGSKFIPGVGLAITAAVGIYDGLTAGITEYKKSGELGKSVEAGIAGAASGLTFGLVSQETFQKGIDGIQSNLSAAWSATTESFSKFKTAVQTELTSENITKKMNSAIASVNSSITKVSAKFTEFTGIELPEIKIPTTAEMKVKFDKFTTSLKEMKMPSMADVSLELSNFKKSAENFTGLKLPDFSQVKKLIEEKFSFKFADLKLPEFPDIGQMITDAIRRIMQPIANLEFSIPIGFGKTIGFKARHVLPQGFLDFVDQTGNYTPKAPSRPASTVTPYSDPIYGERGRGGTPVVINQSSLNTRQGDQYSFAAGIMPSEPGLREATTSYG